MAYEQTLRSIQVAASGDLSASQFCFVTVNSSAQIALTAANAAADGVLQDKPTAAAQASQVAIGGVTKLVTGAAVTAGDRLMADASGRAITATSGNFVNAVALASSSGAGVIIPAIIQLRAKL